MTVRTGTLTIRLDSPEGLRVMKALSAEQRVRLLALLGERAMNVNEIAARLGVSQPTASVHIRVLEEAGLVECEYMSSGRGSEKRCFARFEQIVFELDSPGPENPESIEEIAMPVGLYTAANVLPTCGLASDARIIGFLDNPQSFLLPERAAAQLVWFARGWVEYTFPCDLPPTAEITGIEFVAELCSEAPNYDAEWPSDITVWINGVETGTWTCPGDFGGRRGRLNPEWWSDSLTQYGALKVFSVTPEGSYVDGTFAGDTTLDDLGLGFGRPIVVRIGNRADAVHRGGVNLFGRHFGNYAQDPVLRVRYRVRAPLEGTGFLTAAPEGTEALRQR